MANHPHAGKLAMSLRVHRIKSFADGSHEVLFHGSSADADYISGRLKMEKGVVVTPRGERADGVFEALLAKGSDANPLTRERVVQLLNDDPEIEVMESATNS